MQLELDYEERTSSTATGGTGEAASSSSSGGGGGGGGDVTLNSMSPSRIKQLLHKTLTFPSKDKDYRSVAWNRQLNGALNRVPPDFYDKLWQILERTPQGLKVAGYQMPQVRRGQADREGGRDLVRAGNTTSRLAGKG